MKYYAYAVVSKETPLIQRATLETEASARDFIKVYGDENHSIVRLTSSDAETLEQENYRLKEELRYEKDARASDHFAYLDMQKYAYRVGHKDECFIREKRVEELENVLKKIATFECVCFLGCECGGCYARGRLKALEAKE